MIILMLIVLKSLETAFPNGYDLLISCVVQNHLYSFYKTKHLFQRVSDLLSFFQFQDSWKTENDLQITVSIRVLP